MAELLESDRIGLHMVIEVWEMRYNAVKILRRCLRFPPAHDYILLPWSTNLELGSISVWQGHDVLRFAEKISSIYSLIQIEFSRVTYDKIAWTGSHKNKILHVVMEVWEMRYHAVKFCKDVSGFLLLITHRLPLSSPLSLQTCKRGAFDGRFKIIIIIINGEQLSTNQPS